MSKKDRKTELASKTRRHAPDAGCAVDPRRPISETDKERGSARVPRTVLVLAAAGVLALSGLAVWRLGFHSSSASQGTAGTAGAVVAGKHFTVRWSVAPLADIPPSFSIVAGPQPKGTGPTQPVLDAYLGAIVRRDWATAQAQLCAPLRGAYPTPAALARAVSAELQSPLTAYFVKDAGTSGIAHYQLQGNNWGGGPYQARFVGEGRMWKVCGAGTTSTALSQFGWLVKP
jgi:hypothetical protein